MLLPASIRLTIGSTDVPGQLTLTCALVDDQGDVLEQSEPAQLATGQVLTYGPVRVEAEVTSGFDAGHPAGGAGAKHPPAGGGAGGTSRPGMAGGKPTGQKM
jgi:hypothetical protein